MSNSGYDYINDDQVLLVVHKSLFALRNWFDLISTAENAATKFIINSFTDLAMYLLINIQ